MAVTRAEIADQRRNAFDHLINDLMGLEDTHPISLALKADRTQSIPGIISLSKDDIASLRFKLTGADDVVEFLPLGKGEQRFILLVSSFVIFKRK
jgi:hypothetical protein